MSVSVNVNKKNRYAGYASRVTILIAEDDEDDRLLVEDAMEECAMGARPVFVEDGEQLMAYLHSDAPRPGLVLLDLNMPRKDGREALAEIKHDPGLCSIPVVVFTTSRAEEDVRATYALGVNSFITKPVTFEGLVEVLRTLGRYWLEIVELPVRQGEAS